ncbi:hypothetical protein O2N63_13090 [Aliiroseovarius sp. KMU-50]|uniref:DUF3800 domain-containing protein n=1 Tax=Aliiroseovarius salicola TaxID=3009082 RepID=A0ABT4W3D0_9RHOB|nr:hypothetical protein [Aliiroseovarius sp. KMU-50]MDA5095019.1 hypothetical protein [Aliiroseovarius sp. KMU-50]
MAFLFLDDSKHHRFGFSLAAFVICDTDPSENVSSIFRRYGYDPLSFEFKSSAKMKGDSNLQDLRVALKSFIARECKIGVCVVEGDKNIGPAGLKLLEQALTHPKLTACHHEVFFDEGLFSSVRAAEALIKNKVTLETCNFHFEQNSRYVLGIQLADIVAHTCGTMLLDALGTISKKIVINEPNDDVYHGTEVGLGFEMWASIRYAFLSRNKPKPNDDFELANVDVYPWGLFIDDSADEKIALAAKDRFGQMYLGCLH